MLFEMVIKRQCKMQALVNADSLSIIINLNEQYMPNSIPLQRISQNSCFFCLFVVPGLG